MFLAQHAQHPLKQSPQLSQEFKALPKPPGCHSAAREAFGTAITPENCSKNRYPDVLPYERHRVRLSGESDYINASYIPGRFEHSYVSCQAPLPHTFFDFWRMVWELKSPLIIMLTRFMEKRRVKAHCYWPNEIGESVCFGDMAITLKKVTAIDDQFITIRKFELKRQHQGTVRTVAHIHYTEWPDFGVPDTTKNLRKVVEVMNYYSTKHSDKSIVVHCSAGIGRSGTLLAVHSFLSRHAQHEKVSVRQIVEDMRQRRMGMVQTKEQYRFIYQTIEDTLKDSQRMTSSTMSRAVSDSQDRGQGGGCGVLSAPSAGAHSGVSGGGRASLRASTCGLSFVTPTTNTSDDETFSNNSASLANSGSFNRSDFGFGPYCTDDDDLPALSCGGDDDDDGMDVANPTTPNQLPPTQEELFLPFCNTSSSVAPTPIATPLNRVTKTTSPTSPTATHQFRKPPSCCDPLCLDQQQQQPHSPNHYHLQHHNPLHGVSQSLAQQHHLYNQQQSQQHHHLHNNNHPQQQQQQQQPQQQQQHQQQQQQPQANSWRTRSSPCVPIGDLMHL